ncbi:MAG: cupin domain-containing protein [Dongiaceae bacterium]
MTDRPEDRQPPALDPMRVTPRTGSSYPAEFRDVVGTREKRMLAAALGLTRYGVNLVHLPPGAWSSQRHWHSHEDEFVYLLEGEVTLITDAGEQTLSAGMCAGFPGGRPDGHHLVNRSGRMAIYLEIGDRDPADGADYPDIDMKAEKESGRYVFRHKDGNPYPTE